MAILTSVPAVQFTDTGLVLPQESEILAGVFNDIDTAFGGGVNKALTSPQGQLATSLSAIIADKNEQIALLTNQVNPDYADGVFQDAIGRIYFLERKPATPTIVMCQCVGAVGTQIPIGARALDTSGNIYFCFDGGTIPAGGMIELEFHAQQTGPIPCLAGTLTSIFQMIPGWDTINNEQAGITGADVEGRADFELRRRASVAINAQGSAAAIYANVFNVDEVIDCFVTENPSGTATTLGATAYPLAPHSVYVAAVGGDDDAIAMAIWNKKNLGCDMNGNTTVIVHDTNFAPPYPEYTVKFERPEPLPIKFRWQIKLRARKRRFVCPLSSEQLPPALWATPCRDRACPVSTDHKSVFRPLLNHPARLWRSIG